MIYLENIIKIMNKYIENKNEKKYNKLKATVLKVFQNKSVSK